MFHNEEKRNLEVKNLHFFWYLVILERNLISFNFKKKLKKTFKGLTLKARLIKKNIFKKE